MTPASGFDTARFERLRRERSLVLGAPLTHSATTGSTNDDALAAARAGAPHGATFVADHQSAGRGRRGRTWLAPAGECLLFSVVLKLPFELESLPILSLVAGLSTRAALAHHLESQPGRPGAMGAPGVGVKWPNDVWVRDAKIAGVLVEAQMNGDTLACVVVGIGVNVAVQHFPNTLGTPATSLSLEGGTAAREELLADVLLGLERRVHALLRGGMAGLLEELRAHDVLAGRRVRIETVTGTATGIDEEGRLCVRVADGTVVPVRAGTVELLP